MKLHSTLDVEPLWANRRVLHRVAQWGSKYCTTEYRQHQNTSTICLGFYNPKDRLGPDVIIINMLYETNITSYGTIAFMQIMYRSIVTASYFRCANVHLEECKSAFSRPFLDPPNNLWSVCCVL